MKASEPAFPEAPAVGPAGDLYWASGGLTKREYIAIAAMQGILIAGIKSGDVSYEFFANEAFALADAMIAESEKQ